MKFDYDWRVVSEAKSFDIVDGRGRQRRTTTDYTKSSPEAFGSDELKSKAPSEAHVYHSYLAID